MAALVLASAGMARAQGAQYINFTMVRSSTVASTSALPDARADVGIAELGRHEWLQMQIWGLPKFTDFTLFLTQTPNPPFGVGSFQANIRTDFMGHATVNLQGRFNVNSFTVAQGIVAAPVIDLSGLFPDAVINPTFNPIRTYHLGIFFNSPADAVKAGLPGTVTPFNASHSAGVQVLSTRNFPDAKGPLWQLGP
jgi:hypothetical protein